MKEAIGSTVGLGRTKTMAVSTLLQPLAPVPVTVKVKIPVAVGIGVILAVFA